MFPVLLTLSLLIACGDGDGSSQKPDAAAAAPKPAAPNPQKQLEEARKLALSGKHEDALALAEKVLARKADDDAVWRLVEQEALAASQSRGLLERLDAAKAVGGKTGPHFLLRAQLALASQLPADAITAAKAAGEAEADAAAVLMARAVLAMPAGSPAPEGLPASASALVAWASAADAHAAEPLLAAAQGVKGWRAALFRAERLQAYGDGARALAELGAAAADADPRAKIQANLARARLISGGASGATFAEAGAWASDAMSAALAEGDGKGASEAMDLAVGCLLRAGKAADALTQATSLQKALPADVGAPLQGAVSLAVGRAALAAGDPVNAGAAAKAAREHLADSPDGVAAASWIEGWAAYQLGRSEEVTAAAERAQGARQQVLRGLAALSRGEREAAASALPSAGLDPADGAMAWSEAALADPSGALTWLERAVNAADQSQDPVMKVQTRLAREAAARRGGAPKVAAELRAQLLTLAPQGEAGDALRAEVAARALLEGGKVSFPAGGALPYAVSAWGALAAGAAPQPATDDSFGAGVGLWAEGRAAAAAASAAQIFPAYSEALGKLPLHRQGALGLGTVLDGSQGVPVDGDLALLTAMGDQAPIDAHFALHEVTHRLERFQRDVDGGVDLSAGLPTEKRESLRAAAARARAAVSAWQAGTGPYPKEPLAAMVTAEGAVAKEDAFAALMPTAMVAPTVQLDKLGGVGILSFRVTNGQLHGVVLSKRGSAARSLGPAAKVFAAAGQLRSNLEQAGKNGGTTLPTAGDKVRSILIDPFADMLAGIGRYLVLVPDGLNVFPFTVLPEQSSGLRWLADIRTMAVLPSLATLSVPAHKVETYNPDFLGIGTGLGAAPATTPTPAPAAAEPAAEGLEIPAEPPVNSSLALDELGVSSRIFPSGLKVTATGSQAIKKVWADKAKSARYIHINGLTASADGGVTLTDGVLSLAEVRATPLAAQLVVITAPAPISTQILRAQAFLDAGARNVLVAAWPIPEQVRVRFLGAFYEAIARDRTAARALTEAHEAIVRDDMAGETVADPSSWGSFLLFGTP